MNMPKQLRAPEQALLRADQRLHELTETASEALPEGILHPFSKLADQPQLRAIAGGIVVFGLVSGNERLTRAGARMVIAHEAATAAKDVVKNQVDRNRPRSAEAAHDKRLRKGRHTSKELSSFPSGHSAGAMAAARAFSREYPEFAAAALGAAILVAGTQIPRRAHYLTDVLAGMAIGLASEGAIDRLFGLIWREQVDK